MKLYKGKYLIGIYEAIEDGETLIGLCSNITEFAELMKIKYDNASQILRLLYNKETHYVRFFGKICHVEFILDADDEE